MTDILYDPATEPDWMDLLRRARTDAGEMKYADIAKRSGVSYGTVYNTFTGAGRPSREYLAKIVAGLTPAGSDTAADIMRAYDTQNVRGIKAGGAQRADAALAESITASTVDLVAAIRELTAAVREGFTSRQAQ